MKKLFLRRPRQLNLLISFKYKSYWHGLFSVRPAVVRGTVSWPSVSEVPFAVLEPHLPSVFSNAAALVPV